jgi:hypothetical protein
VKRLAATNGEDYRFAYRFNGDRDPSTRLVQPYAGWIRWYQRFFVLPGPLLALIVLIGLMGMAAAWRRLGGRTLFPWVAGVILILTPGLTSDYASRYVVAAVPAFCIAAATGLQEISRRRSAKTQARAWQSDDYDDPDEELTYAG